MITTTFKPGNALSVGDFVHPEEGAPLRVAHVATYGDRAVVLFADGETVELTADDVVEVTA